MEHNPNRYFSWREFLSVFLNTNCTNYTNKGLENEKIASLKRFVRFERFVFVQSPASILYFLPFGRTLIFISDNRWVSWSNIEHRWVGKEKCCIFALWFRKRSPTRISRIPRILFKKYFSFMKVFGGFLLWFQRKNVNLQQNVERFNIKVMAATVLNSTQVHLLQIINKAYAR